MLRVIRILIECRELELNGHCVLLFRTVFENDFSAILCSSLDFFVCCQALVRVCVTNVCDAGIRGCHFNLRVAVALLLLNSYNITLHNAHAEHRTAC